MTAADPHHARSAPSPIWTVLLGGGTIASPVDGDPLALVGQAHARGGVAWLMVHADDEEALRRAADACGLDAGLAGRASEPGTRPGLDRVDDVIVLTLRTCHLDRHTGGAPRLPRLTRSGCVVLFAGPGFALAVEHGRTDVRKALADRFDHQAVRGADSTELVRLMAGVVTDQYEEIAEALEEATEDADPEPPDDASARTGRADRAERRRRLAAAHHLHRQIFRLRRTAGPAALALGAASDAFGDSRQDGDPLRDVASRLRRVVEQSEQLGEMLDSARDAWTAEVGVSQNDDMRRISAVAALAAVPTVVVGNYGMNFDHMPELHWRWGYPVTIAATVVICAVLYGLFRRLKWL
ncbi:CorA family divalent cation transporter [Streptomyces sp. NPDC005423]|uniref:CorA family divalent cation transporter n=1 Tax=Streptomyces sp. NPDC005423 TaxID=3155343 RepID=UPI0033A320BB